MIKESIGMFPSTASSKMDTHTNPHQNRTSTYLSGVQMAFLIESKRKAELSSQIIMDECHFYTSVSGSRNDSACESTSVWQSASTEICMLQFHARVCTLYRSQADFSDCYFYLTCL